MPHPFEVDRAYLDTHLDELIDVTFADIQSQFLVLPRGTNLIEFARFQEAYEVLKQETAAFTRFNEPSVWGAMDLIRFGGQVSYVVRHSCRLPAPSNESPAG